MSYFDETDIPVVALCALTVAYIRDLMRQLYEVGQMSPEEIKRRLVEGFAKATAQGSSEKPESVPASPDSPPESDPQTTPETSEFSR